MQKIEINLAGRSKKRRSGRIILIVVLALAIVALIVGVFKYL